MENPKSQSNEESKPLPIPLTSMGIPPGIDLSNNPLSYLGPQDPKLSHDEQIKSNVFVRKRNRMSSDKMDIISEHDLTSNDAKDSSSDINMKSPLQKNRIYQMNQGNNHDQFICKKMSMDLDDDITNPNVSNKKCIGCNCKNSGCLKRYCECFSRMKYCDSNCQCKSCKNNIKFEKERTEAIKLYLVKSPVSFKKINMDLNNITCNCKKSNCLKNYCECFQFGLKCTYSCGCVDCKNRNLLEKKLFFVENNCDNNAKKNINNNIPDIKMNINNNNSELIKLDEEANKKDENNKINKNNNNIDKNENIKKNNNSPQFIVNKAVDNNNNNNMNNINNFTSTKQKNRTRFFSFDDESQWSNLNLKRIEISNKKVIIDNYNINQPEEMGYNNLQFHNNNIIMNNNNNSIPSFYNNLSGNLNTNLNNNNFFNSNVSNRNNPVNIRKNSAFSAIK